MLVILAIIRNWNESALPTQRHIENTSTPISRYEAIAFNEALNLFFRAHSRVSRAQLLSFFADPYPIDSGEIFITMLRYFFRRIQHYTIQR